MPLPVWISLQQNMLRNASNMPCNISDEEAAIIVLVVFIPVAIYLICNIWMTK